MSDERISRLEEEVDRLRAFKHDMAGISQQVVGLERGVDEIKILQEKIFDRIDSVNTVLNNHVTDDSSKFALMDKTLTMLQGNVLQHEETTMLRRESHAKESEAAHHAITERVATIEGERKATKRFFLGIAASVIVAVILASGGAILAAIKMHSKMEEVTKTLKEEAPR